MIDHFTRVAAPRSHWSTDFMSASVRTPHRVKAGSGRVKNTQHSMPLRHEGLNCVVKIRHLAWFCEVMIY